MLYLQDRDETETLNPQDRDETETFDFSKLSRPRRDRDVQPSRPRRDETFQKTSQDHLETETFKTETTSLNNSNLHPVSQRLQDIVSMGQIFAVDKGCLSLMHLFGVKP